MTNSLRRLGEMLATFVGRALGRSVLPTWQGSRRKALHPRSEVLQGVIGRHGAVGRTGVAWLDEEGTNKVAVRLSRSLGLPAPRPDILGLALRIPTKSGQFGDVLFGDDRNRTSRSICVVAGTPAWSARLHIAVSLQNPGWPLAAGSDSDRGQSATIRAGYARPAGPWLPFGTLDVTQTTYRGDDLDLSLTRS